MIHCSHWAINFSVCVFVFYWRREDTRIMNMSHIISYYQLQLTAVVKVHLIFYLFIVLLRLCVFLPVHPSLRHLTPCVCFRHLLCLDIHPFFHIALWTRDPVRASINQTFNYGPESLIWSSLANQTTWFVWAFTSINMAWAAYFHRRRLLKNKNIKAKGFLKVFPQCISV